MYKILDNTFLSLAISDVHSVDLIKKIAIKHCIIVSDKVYYELEEKHQNIVLECREANYEKDIDEQSPDFIKVFDYIRTKNVWIGKGEASTIVYSIFLTKIGIDNYIVSDDKRARKYLDKIHNDSFLKELVGYDIPKIKYVGTVGLLLHFCDNGLLSSIDLKMIHSEISKSNFRINKDILDMLIKVE